MIDTHAHLRQIPLGSAASPFDKGDNTQDFGIGGLKWVVLSASCQQDSMDNLELAKTNKKLLPAVGIHPMETPLSFGHPPLKKGTKTIDEQIIFLDNLCQKNKNIVAIGECGLEYGTNPSKSPFDKGDLQNMERLFRGQIALSLKYQKPLIVHSREAAEETVEILKSYENLRGVIHCYAGGKKRIKKYLEISSDWYFGIDGNLTYETGLEEVVKNIPKDRLILETDTPFLTPVPHRGEINRPEYVKYIYQKVAEIWEMSFEEAEKIIDGNAARLFQTKPFVPR